MTVTRRFNDGQKMTMSQRQRYNDRSPIRQSIPRDNEWIDRPFLRIGTARIGRRGCVETGGWVGLKLASVAEVRNENEGGDAKRRMRAAMRVREDTGRGGR